VRGYLDTRWGQVHYSSTGTGGKTIVLFHETPLDSRVFGRLVPELAGSLRVVSLDTPGYGESDPPPGPTTVEEYAAALAEAIDALGLERPSLFGVHSGADFAIELAGHALRDRVDRVVLMGVPFYDEAARRSRVAATVPAFRDDGLHLLELFHQRSGSYDADLRGRMTAAVVDRPGRAYWAREAVYGYAPEDVLPKITAPVLFLSNEGDPLYRGDEMARAVVADGHRIVVPSDQLPLYWTQPERVAAEIKSFVGVG
jgi:pimeloyl-ACP methyl ester carboxylesterase